jgi:hypothetical protein
MHKRQAEARTLAEPETQSLSSRTHDPWSANYSCYPNKIEFPGSCQRTVQFFTTGDPPKHWESVTRSVEPTWFVLTQIANPHWETAHDNHSLEYQILYLPLFSIICRLPGTAFRHECRFGESLRIRSRNWFPVRYVNTT